LEWDVNNDPWPIPTVLPVGNVVACRRTPADPRGREPSLKAIRLMSMDYRILRIMLGGALLLVAAFALGTRLAEWNQEQLQPEPPPVEQSR